MLASITRILSKSGPDPFFYKVYFLPFTLAKFCKHFSGCEQDRSLTFFFLSKVALTFTREL